MFCGRNASLVLARRRRKFFERTLDFLHSPPRAKNNLGFFGGSKWCHIYTFLIFWGGVKNPLKWCHIYTFFTQPAAGEKTSGFLGVKMVLYMHILDFFLGQNAAIYTHFGRCFCVKMLPYVHILGGFWGKKCCHIYTFLEFNFFRKNERKKSNTLQVGTGV